MTESWWDPPDPPRPDRPRASEPTGTGSPPHASHIDGADATAARRASAPTLQAGTMKFVLVGIAALGAMLAMALGARSGDVDPLQLSGTGTASGDAARPVETVYRGEARVTVAVAEFCGFEPEAIPTDVYTVDVPAELFLKPPGTDGDLVEPNPVGLSLWLGDAAGWNASLSSSLVVTTPETARQLLLVYLSVVVSDDRLTARLVDTHLDLGAALNSLQEGGRTPPPQCAPDYLAIRPLAEGAVLEVVFDDEITFVLSAETVDGLRRVEVTGRLRQVGP